MIDRAFKFFSSLWLTVVLLVFALVLVFVGTMAQVKLGLYVAQEEYFRSLFIYWTPGNGGLKIPVFPGVFNGEWSPLLFRVMDKRGFTR